MARPEAGGKMMRGVKAGGRTVELAEGWQRFAGAVVLQAVSDALYADPLVALDAVMFLVNDAALLLELAGSSQEDPRRAVLSGRLLKLSPFARHAMKEFAI